jgi:hypothetical protein
MKTNGSNGPERTIELRSSVLVKDLARLLGVKLTELVMAFIDFKILVNVDQSVSFDFAEKVANKYGFKVRRVD